MKYPLLAFLLALAATTFAQRQDRRPGEILVQLQPGVSIESLAGSIMERNAVDFNFLRVVAPSWNIYLISFDETTLDAETALARARQLPGVRIAQFNHRVEERDVEPNDQLWNQQDDMAFIEAPAAWEYSTGGLTPAGDTIVVAVLEYGALLTHPDLVPNRWFNRAEIPDNEVDDDGNGYVDDYEGWNPRENSDNAAGFETSHGTGVNGIIGAAGNNGVGVAGVNWNVKLMGIGSVEYEDEIVAGYHYADNMRRLYNESNGTRGAFVVATNASFGIDYGRAADYPIWCAVYDSLGRHGILSAAATANLDVDVELKGDIPTTCASEFMITVTNLDKQGDKVTTAGYGDISIDLGAPGEATYTTAKVGANAPGYDSKLGGTSAATPHVSGSIALLYSMGCEPLTSDALTDPVACARRIRDIILNSTAPNPSLAGITTTGGQLNLRNAVALVDEVCEGSVGPLDILSVNSFMFGDQLEVHYQTPIFREYKFRVFNMLGQLLHEEPIYPVQFGINKVVYDGKDLPAGIYAFSIGRGKVVVSRKFPKF